MNSKRTQELFKGIGVIIDNNINKVDSTDRIIKIKNYLENKHFPVLKYEELPSDDEILNFHSISFIVLDWNLVGNEIGVEIPQAAVNDNIHFIKELKKVCFAPIFIFTNESTDEIINILRNKDLYSDNANYIFVENKANIKSGKILFSLISKWLSTTPSIYVLKEWEALINSAKREVFHELHEITPDWPIIMNKTYKKDFNKLNHRAIIDLINKNLTARCCSVQLENRIINKHVQIDTSKEDLRKLLEYERFVKDNPPYPTMGDVYKYHGAYYINIRPDCDIVRDDNPTLYLIKGSKINESQTRKHKFRHGSFVDSIDHSYIPFIDDGKIIDIYFKELTHKAWQDFKDKRIGRLIPPFNTRIKSQYIAFLQRQGIPSIPKKAVK